MIESCSKSNFPTEFVEHIAGRKVLYLLISGVKFYKGDKVEETSHCCNETGNTIDRGTLAKLRVS